MNQEDFFSLAFLLVIPIVAIVGGITMGIIRTVGQQRLAELARRERIAAIERGLDPDKLPPSANPDGYGDNGYGNGRLRRAHGLMIAGFVLIASGIGIVILLLAIEPREKHYVVGFLPTLIGLALLVSSRVIWPRK